MAGGMAKVAKAAGNAKEKYQQANRFFYREGDEKTRATAGAKKDSNFDRPAYSAHVKQRIEYCKADKSHIAEEEAMLAKLQAAKGRKEAVLRDQYSDGRNIMGVGLGSFSDGRVKRGVFSAVKDTVSWHLVPALWHRLTDSQSDAQARAQIAPGTVVATLFTAMVAKTMWDKSVTPRMENFENEKDELVSQIETLKGQIDDTKIVIDQAAAHHDLQRSSSFSA